PRWEGVGNRATLQDRELTGAHDFGFSDTSRAGGGRGELGGIFWRTENPFAYYADRVGPLTLDDPLTAGERVAFTVGAPDSGMYLGWFHRGSRDRPAGEMRNFVGIHLEGPSRVGHYWRPAYATAKGSRRSLGKGPVLVPDGKPHTWKLTYEPSAAGGRGL